MTAAGKVDSIYGIVDGANVIGLVAIQETNNLGVIVFAFDLRSDAKEQVESMFTEFSKVDLKDARESRGEYVKEVLLEWFEAARRMHLREWTKTNAIITTALIPGKDAPLLIIKDMVYIIPSGSIAVDFVVESDGNIETTVAGETVTVTSKDG